MTVDTFLKRLSDKYVFASGKSQYTVVDLEDIERWLLGQNLTPVQIEDLYHVVTTQHEGNSPSLATIIKYFGGRTPSFVADKYAKVMTELQKYKDDWKTWPIEKIVAKCKAIREKGVDVADLADREFLAMYEVIRFEASDMAEDKRGRDMILAHCEYVRRCVEGGEYYKPYNERTEAVVFSRESKIQHISKVV